ncbi:pilin [Saliphagus sp. GCM10025334]
MMLKSLRIVETLSATKRIGPDTLYPAQTVFDTLDCDEPPEFEPLMNLIGSITELAYVFGLTLAVLALVYAGIVMIWGSEESKRRAKKHSQNVVAGVILILLANSIIVFLVRSMDVCQGGF